MDVCGGNFAAVNRDHISRYNQACAQSAQQAGSMQSAQQAGTTQGGFLRNVVSVVTQAARRCFIDNPHQTDLALNYVKSMATDSLSDSLKEATLSFLSEPLKMVLGMIADDVNVSAKDKSVFDNICKTLVNAKGSSKKEMAVQQPLKLLLGKYAQASLNKFIATFTEDCRAAWKQHHTGYETTPADEEIFKLDILACHTMLAKYINDLSSPDITWVEMGQQARYFQSTCAALSKTLLNYEPKAQENGPENPAAVPKDIPDAPVGPQTTPGVEATPIDNGMQYTFPGGPGQSPVVINIHGPSATATAYGAPGEHGIPGENGAPAGNGDTSKAADNKYTLGIELLRNMPKTQQDRDFFREYMQGFLPQLSSVSNGDAPAVATATSTTQADTIGGEASANPAATYGTLADNIESISMVSQGFQAGTGEGISVTSQDIQTDMSREWGSDNRLVGNNSNQIDSGTDSFDKSNINSAFGNDAEQAVQVSTGLLNELLTPPKMSANDRASQFSNSEQTNTQGHSRENMYAASREVANALSSLASELGSPPTTPEPDYPGAFFPDQQSQGTMSRVPLQRMNGVDFSLEGFLQEGVSIDSVSYEQSMRQMSAPSGPVTMANSTGMQSAENSSAVGTQAVGLQAVGTQATGTQAVGLQTGGVNGVQAQMRENLIREKIVSATATSQAGGRVYSASAMTDRENRLGSQEQHITQGNATGEGAAESSIMTQATAREGSVTDATTRLETAATGQESIALAGKVMRESMAYSASTSQAVSGGYSSQVSMDLDKRIGGQEATTEQENAAAQGSNTSSMTTQTARNGSVLNAGTQWEAQINDQDQMALVGNVVRESIPSDTASSQAVDQVNSSQITDLKKVAAVQEQPPVQGQVRGSENNTSSITTPAAGKGADAVEQWENYTISQDQIAFAGKVVRENIDSSVITSQASGSVNPMRASGAQEMRVNDQENPAGADNGVTNNARIIDEKRAGSPEQSGMQRQFLGGDGALTARVTSPANGNSRPAADGVNRANAQQQPAQEAEGDIATPANEQSGVKEAIAAFDKRANAQREANERLVAQRGSGMSRSKVLDNAMGTNINYGKDFFQPVKGLKGNNAMPASHPVYTTSRTIDPFSRVNIPGSNFVKQFNNFDVRPNDLARLNSISSEIGSEE